MFFLNNLKNGRPLFVCLKINLLSGTILPFSCWIPFKSLGGSMKTITCFLSKLAFDFWRKDKVDDEFS